MGMLQTWALFLTLGFVVLAVIQTHRMLREARAATIAAEQATAIARDTHWETVKANIAQLKAYISIVDARVSHFGRMIEEGSDDKSDWYYVIGIVVVFKNIGRSPAEILTGEIMKSDFAIGFVSADGKEVIAADASFYPSSPVTSILNPTEEQNYAFVVNVPRSSDSASYYRDKNEITFDFYGTIDFKDGFTSSGQARHCAFRARRWIDGTDLSNAPILKTETRVFSDDLMAEDWREQLEDEYRKEKGYPPRNRG